MLLITAGLRVPLLNYCEQTESLHIHGCLPNPVRLAGPID